MTSATLHVLRVFTADDGSFGNPLGVFLGGAAVRPDRRQAVAADLGFSETVFVDDRSDGACRIFTPTAELAFAGHPTVGTSWLLAHVGTPVSAVRPPAGVVETWQDGDLRWIRARPAWVHPMNVEQLGSAAAVEALAGPPGRGRIVLRVGVDRRGCRRAWASAKTRLPEDGTK